MDGKGRGGNVQCEFNKQIKSIVGLFSVSKAKRFTTYTVVQVSLLHYTEL